MKTILDVILFMNLTIYDISLDVSNSIFLSNTLDVNGLINNHKEKKTFVRYWYVDPNGNTCLTGICFPKNELPENFITYRIEKKGDNEYIIEQL